MVACALYIRPVRRILKGEGAVRPVQNLKRTGRTASLRIPYNGLTNNAQPTKTDFLTGFPVVQLQLATL